MAFKKFYSASVTYISVEMHFTQEGPIHPLYTRD